MMNKEEFRELLRTMEEGWRAGDSKRVAACFSEEVRYSDPVRYAFAGRVELQEFFAQDEGEPQQVTLHRMLFDEAEQMGAVEYTYEHRSRYHGVALVRVCDGKVTNWLEYQHVSPATREEFVGPNRF